MEKRYTRAELEKLLQTAMEKLREAVAAAQGATAAHEITLQNLKKTVALLKDKDRIIEELHSQLNEQEAVRHIKPASAYLN
jgi:flagellin-specific chaperone FliS